MNKQISLIILITLFLIALVSGFETPIINGTYPEVTHPGQYIAVYGSNFIQNRTYCDWGSNKGMFRALFNASFVIQCKVPYDADAGFIELKVAVAENFEKLNFTYSNSVDVRVVQSNSSLHIAYINPSTPTVGGLIHVTLDSGKFTSANSSQNLCRIGNHVRFAYRDNDETAHCYVPYTFNSSSVLQVSANGGLNWSNSVNFTYSVPTIYNMTVTNYSENRQIYLYGKNFSTEFGKAACRLILHNRTYMGIPHEITSSTMRCTPPHLYYTGNYTVQVSSDSGYHWATSPFTFYYSLTDSRAPRVSFSKLEPGHLSTITGYYFTKQTQCELVSSSTQMKLKTTYANLYKLYVSFPSQPDLRYYEKYYIKCKNSGSSWSSSKLVNIIPKITHISPNWITSSTSKITVYGYAFSYLDSPECKFRINGYTYYSKMNVVTANKGYCDVPSSLSTGTVSIYVSNNNYDYSSSSVHVTVQKSTNNYHHHYDHSDDHSVAIIVPIVVVGAALFILIIALIARKKRMRRRLREQQQQQNTENNGSLELETLDNQPQQFENKVPLVGQTQQINEMPMFVPQVQQHPNYVYLQYNNQTQQFSPQNQPQQFIPQHSMQQVHPNYVYVQPTPYMQQPQQPNQNQPNLQAPLSVPIQQQHHQVPQQNQQVIPQPYLSHNTLDYPHINVGNNNQNNNNN